MKVVVPMAGRGSRFSTEGYTTPKPLLDVAGKPMVVRALESISGMDVSEITFVLLKEHEHLFSVSKMLTSLLPFPTSFIQLDDVTEGQLCTVLAAKHKIDSKEDVLIIASDTYVTGTLANDIANNSGKYAGLISVIDVPGDRWSFARINDIGDVVEVAEKIRISNHASTGIYYFSNGQQLLHFADKIIKAQEKTRGEYYVIPVYQKMITAGLKVGISKATAMWDMGTPEAKRAYEDFLSSTIL